MNNLPERANTGRHDAVKAACACLFRICHRGGPLRVPAGNTPFPFRVKNSRSMKEEKNFPAGNAAGGVPARDAEYTADDLKTALEESERSLHEAVFIARKVWELDSDAIQFDIDDLVQIESALLEICNISAGIDSGDDGE